VLTSQPNSHGNAPWGLSAASVWGLLPAVPAEESTEASQSSTHVCVEGNWRLESEDPWHMSIEHAPNGHRCETIRARNSEAPSIAKATS